MNYKTEKRVFKDIEDYVEKAFRKYKRIDKGLDNKEKFIRNRFEISYSAWVDIIKYNEGKVLETGRTTKKRPLSIDRTIKLAKLCGINIALRYLVKE